MLQLHRPLHSSTSLSLGRLTTAPSWFLEADEPLANQERSIDRNTFTRQRLSLSEPARYSIGKVPIPCAKAVSLPTERHPNRPLSEVPTRLVTYSLSSEENRKSEGGALLPTPQVRGYPRKKHHEKMQRCQFAPGSAAML
jgi:hypothetical protein